MPFTGCLVGVFFSFYGFQSEESDGEKRKHEHHDCKKKRPQKRQIDSDGKPVMNGSTRGFNRDLSPRIARTRERKRNSLRFDRLPAVNLGCNISLRSRNCVFLNFDFLVVWKRIRAINIDPFWNYGDATIEPILIAAPDGRYWQLKIG